MSVSSDSQTVEAGDNTQATYKPETGKLKATHEDFDIKRYKNGRLALFKAEGDKPICGPLWVPGMARDVDGNGWAHVVHFYDQDKTLRQWLMPCSMRAGYTNDILKGLLDRGLWISDAKSAEEDVVRYLTRPKGKRHTITLVSGWHDGGKVYVMPSGEIIGEGDYLLQDAHPYNEPTGTPQEWRDNIAGLCVGNSRLVLAVSVALASPLLHATRADSAGFHLVGGSSLGKSKAAQVAASVFGTELQSWRVTDNGLEGIAKRHSDVGLVMDDMGQSPARDIGAIAYMLGNGQGKARAKQDGSARRVQEWRLMYLSTGEISLSEHMSSVGGKAKAGQELRLLNIEAGAGAGMGLFECIHASTTPEQFADHLGAVAKKYRGTAGPAFIRFLIDNEIDICAQVQTIRQEFAKAAGLTPAEDGQIRRSAGHFALIAAAGELATTAGITGWSKGEAMGAAVTCFGVWRDGWSPDGSREAEQAIAQVRAFIQEHVSRFEYNQQCPVHNRAGFISKDGSEYLIFPEVFKREVCKGLRANTVAKALIAGGYLEVDHEGKRQALRTPDGNGKRGRYYAVKDSILSETGDATDKPPPWHN